MKKVPDWLNGILEPDLQYAPRPLWFWNGKPSSQGIREIMVRSKEDSGYGGFGIIGCDASELDYMEQEYLELYGAALDTAKEHGLKICLYDEWWFPSGNVGGKLKQRYPEHCAKRLDKYEYAALEGEPIEVPLLDSPLMSAVAMHGVTKEILDLRKEIQDQVLSWTAPEAGWTVMLFYCVQDEWDRVDYLEPQSVEKFIELTHETYRSRFGDYFGTVIDSMFYDEPQFYSPKGRMWTPALNEKFTACYGYDPALLYPALWYDIGAGTAAARVALLGFRAELYSQGFPKVLQDWGHQYGLQLTGHVDQEEMINPTGITGDLMKSFQYQDIPGVDQVFARYRGGKIYKIVSSAAYNWDKGLVMTETFGAMGEDLGIQGLYKELMEQFAKGINLIVPHAVWYDDVQNVTFPPELSFRSQQYGPVLREVNQYAARLSMLLQEGRHIADIAVLYPIKALQAGYYMDWGDPYHGGPVLPEFDYQEIGYLLSDVIRKDYTWIHPEILDSSCDVEHGILHLQNQRNWEAFRVLVVPGGSVISVQNLDKICRFYQSGGTVIFTTQLPYLSAEAGQDGRVCQYMQTIFSIQEPAAWKQAIETRHSSGGNAVFLPEPSAEALNEILTRCVSVFDVELEYGDVKGGCLSYIHKQKRETDFYFIANSSDSMVETTVRLRGVGTFFCMNPAEGVIRPVPSKQENGITEISMQLKPVDSICYIRCGNSQ